MAIQADSCTIDIISQTAHSQSIPNEFLQGTYNGAILLKLSQGFLQNYRKNAI
jgi:hypothetical protein